MRSLLIICNTILLLVGNTLLPSVHYLFHHSHNHNDNDEINECQQCIIIGNNNYDLDSQKLDFLGNSEVVLSKLFSLNSINFDIKYSSRAPPFLQYI